MSPEESTEESTAAGPVLRIVNPDATPEEIAAIVAVFSALGGAAPAPEKAAPSWAAHHRAHRVTYPHGRGGWRGSGLPR